jgi:DNA polymerase-3 subunit epsilon
MSICNRIARLMRKPSRFTASPASFSLTSRGLPTSPSPFLEFVRGAELIIHNAPFDLGFLNHELQRYQRGSAITLETLCTVEDTLLLARQRHPGQRNSLDALCKRYNIDNSQRALHGALLDAAILADVYLAMTRQQGSMFGQDTLNSTAQQQGGTRRTLSRSPMPLPVLRARRRGKRRSHPVSGDAG